MVVEAKQFKCGGGGKTIEMWRRARCDYEKEESEGETLPSLSLLITPAPAARVT